MEDELKKQISQLGLDNYIDMLGQVSNPYKYSERSGLFHFIIKPRRPTYGTIGSSCTSHAYYSN